jgi:hypothetical protein
MSTETIESIAPVFTLKPGDEIRNAGRWLEIQSLRQQSNHVILNTYDPLDNRERRFAADPYAERRVRQLTEIAG